MTSIDLIRLGKTLAQAGMIHGSGGNLSCRIEEYIIITASGANLGRLQEADLVVLALDGSPLDSFKLSFIASSLRFSISFNSSILGFSKLITPVLADLLPFTPSLSNTA